MPRGVYQRKYKLYSIQTRLPCHFGNGYILVKHPETGEWVAEHRFVYEEYCGAIREGDDIHHIDENKSNNILSNLQAKPHPKHIGEHKIGNTNARKFTDTHSHCGKCKQILPRSDFGKCKSQASGIQPYCRECKNEDKRKRYANETPAKREKRLEYNRQYDAKRRLKRTNSSPAIYLPLARHQKTPPARKNPPYSRSFNRS